jgi:2-isopropylmalate synthase
MKDSVEFLDTTLRDGNKLPFVVLDRSDRLVIARQLATMGVDIIDAGYPAASREEKEIVAAIASEVKGPRISALCRAVVKDVEETCELLSSSDNPYLHIFLHASPSFLSGVLKLKPLQCLELIKRCLEAAAGFGLPVQFSLGEICEADRGFLIDASRVAAEGGAKVLNYADTNGCLYPTDAGALIASIRENLKAAADLRLGVHFHNDLGLATANTLAGLEAGARHVECTVSGIGGRSGNTPIEEVVFAIEAFPDRFNLSHGIQLEQIHRTSTLLARLTGVTPHPNKPVLGKCAFQETRGSEARNALPRRLQKLMRGQTIGRTVDILFGDQEMSRAGFQQQLESFGLPTEGVNVDKAYGLYQSQVRRKKIVSLSEVQAMVEQARLEEEKPIFELVGFDVMTGSHALPVGSVELKKEDTLSVQSAVGTGPVDALYRAVDKAVGVNPRLVLYSVDHLTEGKDARAEITVSLAYMGRRFHGHSGSTDVIEASLMAYVEAVNNLETHRRRAPAEEFYIDGEELWFE